MITVITKTITPFSVFTQMKSMREYYKVRTMKLFHLRSHHFYPSRFELRNFKTVILKNFRILTIFPRFIITVRDIVTGREYTRTTNSYCQMLTKKERKKIICIGIPYSFFFI